MQAGSEYVHPPIRSTTVLVVRQGSTTVMMADGQVTQGNIVLKSSARKIRRLYNEQILAGFAGSTADAFALFERLEGKLNATSGNLLRSAVDLAKEWRMDKALRPLEAMLVVADTERTLLVTGNGDVVEPDESALAIGSGGPFALAAARALIDNTDLDAKSIADKAMEIASKLCIYTNSQRTVEILENSGEES